MTSEGVESAGKNDLLWILTILAVWKAWLDSPICSIYHNIETIFKSRVMVESWGGFSLGCDEKFKWMKMSGNCTQFSAPLIHLSPGARHKIEKLVADGTILC